MMSYCSRCIQPHRAAMNQGNEHVDEFYVSHTRSSFGTVRGRDDVTHRAYHGHLPCQRQ